MNPKKTACKCGFKWDGQGNVKEIVYCDVHQAAPEMLEALKHTTSWLEAIYKQGLINPQSSVPDWIKKGNAAIAKATG